MLQIQRRRELPTHAVLKILQNPIKQLRVAASRSRRPMKIHQLTFNSEERQQRHHFRGPDPLPGVHQPAAQLLGTLDIEPLRPRLLYEALEAGYARNGTARRLLALP